MSYPTIHTVVMEERTSALFELLEREVDQHLRDFRMSFVAGFEETVRKAYMRGVVDGFQQGALAAEKQYLAAHQTVSESTNREASHG